ncbi:MAG TPA: response regulator [Haliangiales bacterium]|nr:response regulator [Haliangiales bacterium]
MAKEVHFLLVEDDEVDARTIRRALEKHRVTNPVTVASDGQEALDLLQSGQIPLSPLVVLLDLNMPRMNGLELLRAMRRDPRLAAVTVVVLTVSADEPCVVEAYQLNAAGYLQKPVRFEDFSEMMGVLHKYWTLVEML